MGGEEDVPWVMVKTKLGSAYKFLVKMVGWDLVNSILNVQQLLVGFDLL